MYGLGERFLNRFFRVIDAAAHTDQGGHRTTVLLSEHTLDQSNWDLHVHPPCLWRNGRTSIGSVTARASFRPHSNAASKIGCLNNCEPAEMFLALDAGPVSDEYIVAVGAQDRRRAGRVKPAGVDERARTFHLFVQRMDPAHDRFQLPEAEGTRPPADRC